MLINCGWMVNIICICIYRNRHVRVSLRPFQELGSRQPCSLHGHAHNWKQMESKVKDFYFFHEGFDFRIQYTSLFLYGSS